MSAKKTTSTKKRTTKRASTKKSPTRTTKSSRASTKKRATSRSSKKKAPVYASDEQCFWMSSGPVLASLADLHNALNEMDDEVYAYHATGDQNDFAEWVECVLHDGACAGALRRAKKKNTAANAVKRCLVVYAW